MTKRVVVLGGGVIGVSCALELSRAGLNVTLLESQQTGSQASHANCGLICPSHALPLNTPGATGKTLRMMLQRNSPVAVGLRFDPSLWSWLWRFSRNCTHQQMMAAAAANNALLQSSMELYQQAAADGLRCEWEHRGGMFVFQSEYEFEKYSKTDKLLREEFDLGAQRFTAAELEASEPALAPGSTAGGWKYGGDAHLRPDVLMRSLREKLDQAGVQVLEETPATGIVRDGAGAAAVVAGGRNAGEIPADIVVAALGAATPLLGRQLGYKAPVQPGKGYSITMPRPQVCPQIPLLFQEHKVVVTPMQSGYRLGSMMEFRGHDAKFDNRRISMLIESAKLYLREPVCEPIEEHWTGLRPMTNDGMPIIGRCPNWSNVYLATGHGMLGLSMAPGTARLISELVQGETPHVNAAPFRADRF